MALANISLVIAAIAVGALVPIQAAFNATLAAHAGHALFAAVVNFVLATVVLVGASVALNVSFPIARIVREVPWYAWAGGLCGATMVVGTIVLAPKLGAAAFVSCMIVGTMVLSLLLDHHAVLVFREQPLTWQRLCGGALVVVGMVIVQRS